MVKSLKKVNVISRTLNLKTLNKKIRNENNKNISCQSW